jgi:hypothetical protein
MMSEPIHGGALFQSKRIARPRDVPAPTRAPTGGRVQARSEPGHWPKGLLWALLPLVGVLVGCGGGGAAEQSSGTSRRSQSGATTTPSIAKKPTQASAWPYAKLVGSLSGQTLVLPHGRVRLDGALLECNGRGTPVSRGRVPRWGRYTCTQTLVHGGVDRDVTFDVEILSGTRLKIMAPRYGPE